MKKQFKVIITWFVIGLLVGVWFGVNIGRGQTFYSNPFAERSIQEKLKHAVGEGVEKVGESVEKFGEDLKGKLEK